MAGKKKTTFAKMNRESKLREKRAEKEMRKDARKREESGATDTIGEPHQPIEVDADELEAILRSV